jgi:hypothetical protein
MNFFSDFHPHHTSHITQNPPIHLPIDPASQPTHHIGKRSSYASLLLSLFYFSPNMNRLVLLLAVMIPNVAWTFSTSTFGRCRSPHSNSKNKEEHYSLAFASPPTVVRTQPFFLLAKKPVIEDDEGEPGDEDLINGIEGDLDLDDELLLDAEEVVVVDDKETASEDDDEHDDDDDDLDIEIEDDEEITEEIVSEVEGDDVDEEEWEDEEEENGSYTAAESDDGEENFDDEYITYPLEDDPEDPDYQAQKKLVEETIARREKLAREKNFDELDFMMNLMTPAQAEEMDKMPFIQEAEATANELMITESDVENIDLDAELAKTSDWMDDDPYPNEGETDILGSGVSDDDMEGLDDAWKTMEKNIQKKPWNAVNAKADTFDWDSHLNNETTLEMEDCLKEIGGSTYDVPRWLLYDLDFNVSNLILAAVKHKPDAPILFQHWYPQLQTYSRYQHARDRDFNFNWHDVQNADMSELERYYAGFGYTEIPAKAPAETGIIGLEDMDEEECKMAAFENWMIDVYNPEWDRKDFDDEEFQDEDNVFSKFYVAPLHPDLPLYEDAQDDLKRWREDNEQLEENAPSKEYQDYYGREFEYTVSKDKEFERDFRGHLIVACTGEDEDLEIAEKITRRMAEELGKQIYVETRVYANAKEEDCVFEVWLESYEVDLLHSKKRATSNAKGWFGPAECDDKQVEYLVDHVGFLVSDDARYSYRMESEGVV